MANHLLVLTFLLFIVDLTSSELFQGLTIYYNQQVPVHTRQNILITVKSPGNQDVNIELHTPTYVIASFLFPAAERFQHTKHLSTDCKKFGITNSNPKPPNTAAHYKVIDVMFVLSGSNEMTLKAIDPDNQNEYFKETYQIDVFTPPGHECIPRIRFSDCSSPHNLRKVVMHEKVIVQPIVEKTCGRRARMTYAWKVNDFLDKETRLKFPEQKSSTLRIPAFKLWFNDEHTIFHKFYTIKLKFTESGDNNTTLGVAYGRCYIAALTAPPVATIKFGSYREVNVNKSIKFDGSDSRDMTSPKNGINLSYRWSCSSHSGKKSGCKQNMGFGQILRISPNILSVNQKYAFTLEVKSTRTMEVTKCTQVIMTTMKDPLVISHICINNCQNGISNPRYTIHIKAHCHSCNEGSPTYKWTLQKPKAMELPEGLRLFMLPSKVPLDANLLTLRLSAQYGSRTGFIEFEIKIAKFLKIGSCYISPKDGIECSTEFKISCFNFVSDFEPITYSIFQGNQLISSEQNSELRVKLWKRRNSAETKVRVEVADSLNNIYNVHLKVLLKSLDIPVNSKDILKFVDKDLNESVSSGDISSVVVKVQTITSHLTTLQNESAKIYITEKILGKLGRLNLATTEDVEMISSMLNRLIMNITLNHTLAKKTSNIFEIVSDTLEDNIFSGDILDLTPEKSNNITEILLETAEQFFELAEEFPSVHTVDIPRPDDFEDENYPDYGDLDFEIVYRINNWMHFARSTTRLFHKLGMMAFKINEAEEINHIKTDGVEWIVKMIGSENTNNVVQKNLGSTLSIPASLLKTLMPQSNDPKAKVGVQIVFPLDNPYWWYPTDHKTSTHITIVNVFSEKYNTTNFTVNEVSKKFNIYFQIVDELDRQPFMETHGFVLANEDMPIYQCVLPRYAYISIEFMEVSSPIRVLTKVGLMPKYKEIQESYIIVRNKTQAFDIVEFNNGSEDSIIYIAIYPHGSKTQTTTYHFKSTIYACNTWDPNQEKWATNYCFVRNSTNLTHIHCECWHFSNFAARLFKTPNSIELPRNVILALFANVPFLLLYMLVVFLLLGVIFWAKKRDEEDKVQSQILQVDPYNPSKTYMYLATISTGSYKYAGTTAKISLELIGLNFKSEKYYFSVRKFYGALKRNSENNFTLMTTRYLGPINSIILTNDYSGNYPSWYCNFVRVKDPARKEEFVFLVNKWFSKIHGGSLQAEVELATEKQVNNWKFIVLEHFKRCYRDLCTWYGLLFPSHRSPLNRVEKAMVLVTGFSFGAMLSIMFFERTTLDNIEEERVKYRRFILTFSNVLHTIICTIIAVFCSIVIIEMFMRSKRLIPVKYNIIYAEEKIDATETKLDNK